MSGARFEPGRVAGTDPQPVANETGPATPQ